jgi:hypothetical protein
VTFFCGGTSRPRFSNIVLGPWTNQLKEAIQEEIEGISPDMLVSDGKLLKNGSTCVSAVKATIWTISFLKHNVKKLFYI